jgi:uncharacterized DUF497 family protein
MEFDWNDEKNRTNFEKHGVSFELAAYVFDDPHHRTVPCLTRATRRNGGAPSA